MSNYNEIVEKVIKSNYCNVLLIGVFNDKIYKYKFDNNNLVEDSQQSYMDYLNKCRSFIYQNDIDDYVESLSLSALEKANGNKLVLNYKMLDNDGKYYLYNNVIKLCELDGQKIVVVLVSKTGDVENKIVNTLESNIEVKLSKMVDCVGLAILKIHSIMNTYSNFSSKKEYINSILSNMINEFPEFNDALNNNAINMYGNEKSTIMIIDDDKVTCGLIKKIFDKNYDIIVVNNGKEAIDYLKDNEHSSFKVNLACIFLDLLMPVLDGFSVLDYLNVNNYLNKLPVIIISGNYDKDTRNKAYSYQIADMLEKPFNVQVIRHRIENLINLYRLSNSFNNIIFEQHKELKNIISALIDSYEIDNAVCMKMIKKYTHSLTLQVSVDYPEYNINSNMIDKMANSAMYYGIGNYTLPKSVLYKKGMYTEKERSLIKMVNINGAGIIKHVLAKNNTFIDARYCYDIARYYNERYDGNGYPEGLSGSSIPLSAQIASLAIEYCNLINTITPVDYDRVSSLIIMESGKKFSPKIVESFKKIKSEFEEMSKVGE